MRPELVVAAGTYTMATTTIALQRAVLANWQILGTRGHRRLDPTFPYQCSVARAREAVCSPDFPPDLKTLAKC
uniref:Uncharacterized protein n=1 Tax=Peronospora matthiolae TaxID=2874970 RepID=A0AAV1T4J6_9STRA